MKPLSLHLENVRTFDVLDFDFPEGACAIVGPNGSGKSTTVSALDVALFGAEGRSLADWLSRDRPEQTMVIALTFEHGGETYRVRRSFSGKGRGTSRVDFEISHPLGAHDEAEFWHPLTRESAAATQEEIERIIGLDRASFRASAFMAQGDGGAFCESTPGRRKEILASVLGLGIWDEYRERARADLRAAAQSLAVVRAKIESAETDLAERPGLALLLDQAKENEQAARSSLEECASQLGKARERLSKLREQSGLREAAERGTRAAEDALAGLLARISGLEWEIREQIDARLAEREGLETLVEGLPGLEAEQKVLAGEAEDYAERRRLERDRSERLARIEQARREGDRLRDLAEDVLVGAVEKCDRCAQPLPDDARQRAAESYRAEAQPLFVKVHDESREIVALEQKIAARPSEAPDPKRIGDVATLIRLGLDAKAKLAALAEVEARRDAALEELQKVRAELPEREAIVGSARAELQALGPHDPEQEPHAVRAVHVLEVQEADQRRTLDATLQDIARLDERLARLDKLAEATEHERKQVEAFMLEVELLSHLERACGPNGVPALILETSAIPQMEAEWNRLLRLLPTDSGDLFEVELHTQREKKSGDGAVDALDIVVYSGGVSRPYATYSGGERMRIDIAQRRALSSLLAHRKGAECPLMILDEPNSLDDQGMAALAQVLEDLAVAEGLTILCVSHDPALRDAFESSIWIEKVDGRSRIVGSTEPTPTLTEVAT